MAKKSTRKKSAAKSAARSTKSAKTATARNTWTAQADRELKTLIKQNTPTRLIAMKLKRTEAAVRGHTYKLGLSLRPTNRSPYG